MIELVPCVEIGVCLGGYVVKTVTYDGNSEWETNHRVVFTIAEAFDVIRRAIESTDAMPDREHDKIQKAMNG